MWFIHFIPLEPSLHLCCVAIHGHSFLSAKSHCLVARCRNQSKSLGTPVGSIFLDQEPPVWWHLIILWFLTSFYYDLAALFLFLRAVGFLQSQRMFCAGGWVCDYRLAEPHPGNTSVWGVEFLPMIPRVFLLMSLLSHLLEFSFSMYSFGVGSFFHYGKYWRWWRSTILLPAIWISLQASVQLCFKEALLSVTLQPAYPTLHPVTWPCFNILPPSSFFSKDFLKLL